MKKIAFFALVLFPFIIHCAGHRVINPSLVVEPNTLGSAGFGNLLFNTPLNAAARLPGCKLKQKSIICDNYFQGGASNSFKKIKVTASGSESISLIKIEFPFVVDDLKRNKGTTANSGDLITKRNLIDAFYFLKKAQRANEPTAATSFIGIGVLCVKALTDVFEQTNPCNTTSDVRIDTDDIYDQWSKLDEASKIVVVLSNVPNAYVEINKKSMVLINYK